MFQLDGVVYISILCYVHSEKDLRKDSFKFAHMRCNCLFQDKKLSALLQHDRIVPFIHFFFVYLTGYTAWTRCKRRSCTFHYHLSLFRIVFFFFFVLNAVVGSPSRPNRQFSNRRILSGSQNATFMDSSFSLHRSLSDFSSPRWDFVMVYIFTNPSARAGYDTRSIFKRSLIGLNSEFSFS